MQISRTCLACGAQLSPNTPEGLCPQCVLKQGLVSDIRPDAEPTLQDEPPGVHRESQTPTVSEDREPTEDKAGTTIKYFGDYELLEEIGRGGMGVVFKARQVSLNRIVAVKMIRAGQIASETEVKRFHLEAEAAATLQHPNIVAVHEVGKHAGRHYFSMDFVEGKSLAVLLKEGPLSPVRAATYLKALADAIHYAHRRRILHRDLKPSNVLIDEADQPRIADFGLAKRLEQDGGLTRPDGVLGTPAYMPPEQGASRFGSVGPPSDVYALGAILYELLTGQAPFHGATPMETILQVLEDPPVKPRKVNPRVPKDLETICLKCLEKRPHLRYSSALALSEELARFLNQEPILSRQASPVVKALSWFKRHPWALVGAALVLMLGLFWLAFGLWVQNRYLFWTMQHPGQPASEFKGIINVSKRFHAVYLLLCFGLLPVLLLSRSAFKHHSRRGKLQGRPVHTGFLLAYGGLGLVGIATVVFSVTYFIDETLPPGPDWYWAGGFFCILTLLYIYIRLGALILKEAAREYRLSRLRSSAEILVEIREQEKQRLKRAVERKELHALESLALMIFFVIVLGPMMIVWGTACISGFFLGSATAVAAEHLIKAPRRTKRIASLVWFVVSFGCLAAICRVYAPIPVLCSAAVPFLFFPAYYLIQIKVWTKLAWTDANLYRRAWEGMRNNAVRLVLKHRAGAEMGDNKARLALGQMYWLGIGVPQDDGEAAKLFREAAEEGLAEAQFLLGLKYWTGQGLARDNTEAAAWFRKAATQGLRGAQLSLGVMLRTGVGVVQDPTEAIHWFRQAAKQGSARAEFELGTLYGGGVGVTKDEREGLRWFKRSATRGFAAAQYELGCRYEAGRDVPLNDKKAVKWWKMAAEQGHRWAQASLGRMYRLGRGVGKDSTNAFIWFTLALEQGHTEVSEERNSVAEALRPQQIVKAKRRLDDMKKRITRNQVAFAKSQWFG